MTTEENPTQKIRARLREGKCTLCDLELDKCSTHEEINVVLIKQLKLDVPFEETAQGRYARTPRGLATVRRYRINHPEKVQEQNATEAAKQARLKYRETDKGKKAEERYAESESRKAVQARYRESEKGRLAKEKELSQRKIQRRLTKGILRIKRELCTMCERSLNCTDHTKENEFFKMVIAAGKK